MLTCCSEIPRKICEVRSEIGLEGLFFGHIDPQSKHETRLRSELRLRARAELDPIFDSQERCDALKIKCSASKPILSSQQPKPHHNDHVIITIQPPHRSRHLPTPPPPLRHTPRSSPRLHQTNPRRRRIPQRRSRPPPRRVLCGMGRCPRYRLLQ